MGSAICVRRRLAAGVGLNRKWMEHAGQVSRHRALAPRTGNFSSLYLPGIRTLISRQSHIDDHLGSQFGREVSPHPLRWPVTMTHDQGPRSPKPVGYSSSARALHCSILTTSCSLSSSLDGAGAVGTVYTHPEVCVQCWFSSCRVLKFGMPVDPHLQLLPTVSIPRQPWRILRGGHFLRQCICPLL